MKRKQGTSFHRETKVRVLAVDFVPQWVTFIDNHLYAYVAHAYGYLVIPPSIIPKAIRPKGEMAFAWHAPGGIKSPGALPKGPGA